MGGPGTGGSRADCAVCGETFDVEEWHPARLVERDDADVRLVEFCSDECLEDWDDGAMAVDADGGDRFADADAED